MELNWSTFVLELINFAVLVWILQHFFYRPVLAVIKKRQQNINKSLAEAKALDEEAAALKSLYENRLAVWEQEKQRKLEMLRQEIATERAKRMDNIKVSLDEEREKVRVVIERRQLEAQRKNEETALLQGARFSARLLEKFACPDLESRIFDLMIDQIEALPTECVESLCAVDAGDGTVGIVSSAYELKSEDREKLEDKINSLVGKSLPFRYEQDPALLAGFRITLGPWVFRANLKDELKSFTEIAHVI